ncbi:MAG: hypothetical protein LQ352_001445 [Teloschistes flavicans]|nr:MAG: hypothetical protein LQ352_001445 [Teloschistes flavicans]
MYSANAASLVAPRWPYSGNAAITRSPCLKYVTEAECDDFAATFVRGRAEELRGENAGRDHAVRVTEGGDFDFEEEIMRR